MNEQEMKLDTMGQNDCYYLNSLFNELKEKKIRYYSLYSPSVSADFHLVYYSGHKEKKQELEDFEAFVWGEYAKIMEEHVKAEKTKTEKIGDK